MEETIEDNTFLMVLRCHNECTNQNFKEASRLFIRHILDTEQDMLDEREFEKRMEINYGTQQ